MNECSVINILCNFYDRITGFSRWCVHLDVITSIFSDESLTERGFIADATIEDTGFLGTDYCIGDFFIFIFEGDDSTDVDTTSFFLFIDDLVSSWFEHFFELGDTELHLCLLITSCLVLGIFREITIGDGLFEFFGDFDTLFFT